MGCTEPIALAYGGAKARQVLGCLPDRVQIRVSGNIIKNVKSVIVPNTGGLHGIAPAVCAGIVAGDADRVLEVISRVTDDQRQQLKEFMQTARVDIAPSDSDLVFDIDLKLCAGAEWVHLRIVNHHTNIVLIEKNGDLTSVISFEVLVYTFCLIGNKSMLFFVFVQLFGWRILIKDVRMVVFIEKNGISVHFFRNFR